ncbi:hypothetical protein JYU34_008063 [Plutella xylostella]|uniref:Uncharacterized protein n=1 Tax=Plutella xylostella TaxID=51655 RepID=A0ABQ7QNM2_PLUXY|nr:hypothetical protein JYU34_008063 [Plutella xylostella]
MYLSHTRYLAERLDLPRLLRMDHPEKDDEWSPRDICDGWAKKRGYLTAKAARLDTYRAANSLLRMALDGKICLWLRPPGYSKEKEKWETCDEIKYIRWVQSLTEDAPETVSDIDVSDDDRGPVESEPTDDDDDDEDSSDDGAHVTVMANKFAALGGDD